uniref:(California timema) hypothetical protein n=1 Tax=Timema californicum TaxID=61474 RepID=A0A7R9J2Q3_TIMCA|nr:unnamed protein product [Timema californicum]
MLWATMCQPPFSPVSMLQQQQVVMKGLYDEGTQDFVTLVFIHDPNSTPWLIRLHNLYLKRNPISIPSEWTSHSTRRATARRGRAQPTTQGKKGEGEWANHAARGPKKMSFIRDISGSYNLAIVAINSLTALTITMWLIEIIIVACRDRKKNKTNT